MFKFWKRFKKAISDLLENMAKENEKTFGSGRLDCCQINNDKNEEKS